MTAAVLVSKQVFVQFLLQISHGVNVVDFGSDRFEVEKGIFDVPKFLVATVIVHAFPLPLHNSMIG